MRTIDTELKRTHIVGQIISGGRRMFTNEMQIEFSNGTKVRFVVESSEELSKHHTLGCIEVACGELISQNREIMEARLDD